MCEAESGFRYINGFPDPQTGGLAGPPVRPNISLGDSVAGLHAAFGTVCPTVLCCGCDFRLYADDSTLTQVLALLARRVKQDNGLSGGSTVDVSILERYALPKTWLLLRVRKILTSLI